jgi:peroxiredoxin
MSRSSLIIAVGLLGVAVTAGTALAERAENFTLRDQDGVTHELYGLKDAEAVVIMIQGNGCPIVRNAWPVYRQLRETYRAKRVEFLMLNANLQDDATSVRREAETFKIDAPILLDEKQSVAESLNLIRTAEVLLIDPGTWEIVYRGPLDDRLTYEAQKPAATEHYLRDGLDAMLAGRPIETPRRDALGCLINLPNSHAH